MRIDIIQPAPVPEIPKVSQGNSTSANYGNDFSRQLKKSVSDAGRNKNDSGQPTKEEIEAINEKMRYTGKKLQFKIHKDPNQIIAQIVDVNTNEVIEEIPSEKMLDMISSLGKIYGQNIDKKV
jgi:flagellar protein FlaG